MPGSRRRSPGNRQHHHRPGPKLQRSEDATGARFGTPQCRLYGIHFEGFVGEHGHDPVAAGGGGQHCAIGHRLRPAGRDRSARFPASRDQNGHFLGGVHMRDDCVAVPVGRGEEPQQVSRMQGIQRCHNPLVASAADSHREYIGGSREVYLTRTAHRIECRAPGYKPKTRFVNPPYGGNEQPISFFFMVGDKVDAPDSWAEVHSREKIQKQAESMGFGDYRQLAATIAAKMGAKVAGGERVAVTGFSNRDTDVEARFTSAFQDEIISALVGRNIAVVKRDRLNVVLAELKLQASGLMERKRAAELGRIAGAHLLLSGTYADRPGEGVVIVNADLVRAESGTIVSTFKGRLLRKTEVLQLLER